MSYNNEKKQFSGQTSGGPYIDKAKIHNILSSNTTNNEDTIRMVTLDGNDGANTIVYNFNNSCSFDLLAEIAANAEPLPIIRLGKKKIPFYTVKDVEEEIINEEGLEDREAEREKEKEEENISNNMKEKINSRSKKIKIDGEKLNEISKLIRKRLNQFKKVGLIKPAYHRNEPSLLIINNSDNNKRKLSVENVLLNKEEPMQTMTINNLIDTREGNGSYIGIKEKKTSL